MQPAELVPILAVAFVTIAASVTDLWTFKIYNALTLPALALGIVASAVLGGWAGLGASLLGAGLGFALLAFFFTHLPPRFTWCLGQISTLPLVV